MPSTSSSLGPSLCNAREAYQSFESYAPKSASFNRREQGAREVSSDWLFHRLAALIRTQGDAFLPTGARPSRYAIWCRGTDCLAKLERAWGSGPHQLNVDSIHNLIFPQADWRALFNESKPKWVLIPELPILEKLRSITVKARKRNIARGVIATKLETFFNSHKTFRYHVLPTRRMKEPLRRFLNADDNATHKSGQKISKLGFGIVPILQVIDPTSDPEANADRLTLIEELFRSWTSSDSLFSQISSAVGDEGDDSDEDSGSEEDQGHGADDRHETSLTSSQGNDLEDDDSAELLTGEEHIAGTWPAYGRVSEWVKDCEAASEGGWELDLLNDDQMGPYAKEAAHRAPRPKTWKKWEPYWRTHGMENYLNRSQYSSNDWAAYEGHAFLPHESGRRW